MNPAGVSLPVCSVVVLNYNRKTELEETLKDILAQDYPHLEVCVADNASTDGSAEMVRDKFPSVKCHAMETNIGIHARRKAAEAVTGKYVMMYDDDSGPSTPGDISRLVDAFERRPEISAICTAIYRTRSGYSETWGWESYAVSGNPEGGYEGLFVHGSGTAYRREHLLKTEAFDNDLFWGDEEFDAALNLIAHERRILYLPSIVTNHRASMVNRNKGRFYRRVTRNHLLTLFRYFGAIEAIGYSCKEIVYQSLLSRAYFPWVLAGVVEAIGRAFSSQPKKLRISASFEPYIKEVRQRRYPGPLDWYRQQKRLRDYRKTKAY